MNTHLKNVELHKKKIKNKTKISEYTIKLPDQSNLKHEYKFSEERR
jgi:hypothetical protein